MLVKLKTRAKNDESESYPCLLSAPLKLREMGKTNTYNTNAVRNRKRIREPRQMRLRYIYRGDRNEPHPFHVKSNWVPPVQPSVALETVLEEVKFELT